jgi:hypothetical protein
MREGLWWYDDDPALGLAEKVQQAVQRHRQKFGATPNICYVHPSMLEDDGGQQQVGSVCVAPLSSVLRHHFWLGQRAST